MTKAVIFDLDGTLLDTLDDLADSCNKTLEQIGFPLHSRDEIRMFVGNGLGVLIEKAIPKGKENPLYEKTLSLMRQNYALNWHNKTCPYEDILSLLKKLRQEGIKTGIVSNKPDAQVKELAELYFKDFIEAEAAIGEKESEGVKRKPAPDSVLKVMEYLHCTKEETVYIGDSDVDIATARNAEIPCVSVSWGFRSREFLQEHEASFIIDTPLELLDLIKDGKLFPQSAKGNFTSDSDSDAENESPDSGEKDRFLKGEIARELDFYRIRDSVASYAMSEEGKAELLQREPCSDWNLIRTLKDLGREWNVYIHSSRPQALYPWPAVKDLFSVLAVEGAQLAQDQLFALGLFAKSCIHAKESLSSANEEFSIPCLAQNAAAVPDLKPVESEIFSVLTLEGEVKDLPSLRAIRIRIASLHREVENAIRRYTSDPAFSSALQSSVPAYRQDRELLAVRSDRKSAINGIVHEVSASGQTLYIEPDEVVRANNELVEAEFELQAEMRKIFQQLTQALGPYRQDLIEAHKTMILFDSTYAAARWQKACSGIFAQDCDLSKEPPCIKGARHPLLGDRAVPVDIGFMDGKNVLIITGPNTGGKTVTLKTIALFVLLNQAGFPIPASEGTRLPFFTSVFADIGDEQSIDQSLSTFSAHMKKTALMTLNANDTSLVLLDELGSGTDPQEGSAIAMATLDCLIQKKSFVIVTTHHGILKNYGYTNKNCINASVEFDTSTLRPTYRLMMGVPGESHAIDIARRSGLPEEIVQKARSYIASEQADVSALIKGLNAKHAELDELLRESQARAQLAEQKELKLAKKDIEFREREIELKKAEHRQSSEFLVKTRSRLENLVRELREGEITREKTLGVKNFISELTSEIEAQETVVRQKEETLEQKKNLVAQKEETIAQNGMRLSGAKDRRHGSAKKTRQKLSNTEALKTVEACTVEVPQKLKKAAIPPVKVLPKFVPGAEVLAGRERRKGVLLQKNKNGTWQVQFGALRMAVPQSHLMVIEAPKDAKPQAEYTVENDISYKSDERPVFELRLLGMRYEEAMRSVEKQLDLCAIHNFRNFSIIHGKGSGVLQQAVQDYLSHYPGVKDFHFAAPEDGGTGKTYVELF